MVFSFPIDRDSEKPDFYFVLSNPQGTIFWTYNGHEEEGRQLYEAIKQSTHLTTSTYPQQGDEWRLQLQQVTENYRDPYRKLDLLIRSDGEFLWLIDQGHYYVFRASHELVEFLQPLMKTQTAQ